MSGSDKQPTTEFNNGAKPLIMAYIGYDDPNRGDSKVTVGLAKLTAQMLDGEYVYADATTIYNHFPNVERYEDKVKMFMDEHGSPDILIGRNPQQLDRALSTKPSIVKSNMAESMSSSFIISGAMPKSLRDIVPHNLTDDALDNAAQDLEEHHPDLKGPVIAVMMGGEQSVSSDSTFAPLDETAQKITDIAAQYPEATIFVCASRRTEGNYEAFMAHLNDNIPDGSNVDLIGADYDATGQSYNPYMGLLGGADEIVIVGDSFSMISEALYTEKTIYLDRLTDTRTYPDMHKNTLETDFRTLRAQGHIKNIDDLAVAPFPTEDMPRIDVTKEVAQGIADEFKEYHHLDV